MAESIRREDFHLVDLSDIIDPEAPKLAPVHPGEILAEDYLAPLGLSANALALALRVPANRITGILHGRRAVTADTALRLAQYFGGSADFWLRLQARHDLEIAQDASGERIRREVLPRNHASTG